MYNSTIVRSSSNLVKMISSWVETIAKISAKLDQNYRFFVSIIFLGQYNFFLISLQKFLIFAKKAISTCILTRLSLCGEMALFKRVWHTLKYLGNFDHLAIPTQKSELSNKVLQVFTTVELLVIKFLKSNKTNFSDTIL